jgi:hypothetical protein
MAYKNGPLFCAIAVRNNVNGLQLVNLRLMGWPSFPWHTISPPSSFRQFLINLKNITHFYHAQLYPGSVYTVLRMDT